jgi:hypothetical protein
MENRPERGRPKLMAASCLLFSLATLPGAICSKRYVQQLRKLVIVVLAQARIWQVALDAQSILGLLHRDFPFGDQKQSKGGEL